MGPCALTSQRTSRDIHVHRLLVPDVDLLHEEVRRSRLLGEPGMEKQSNSVKFCLLFPPKDLSHRVSSKHPSGDKDTGWDATASLGFRQGPRDTVTPHPLQTRNFGTEQERSPRGLWEQHHAAQCAWEGGR